MSWSISGSGTKAACKRMISAASIYGSASDEEKAKFEEYRGVMLKLVDDAQEPEPESKQVVMFTFSMSGHGSHVSALTFTSAWFSLE